MILHLIRWQASLPFRVPFPIVEGSDIYNLCLYVSPPPRPTPSLRSTTVIELHACAIRSKHPVAVVTDGYRHAVYYIGYDGNSVVTPQLPTCVLCNFRVSVMTVTLPVDC